MMGSRWLRWAVLFTAALLFAATFAIVRRGVAHAQGASSGPSTPSRSGEALYLSTCASCHGADGRGASRSEVGFDLPLPDLTDCNFNVREPRVTWLAVTHRGGPARGFDETMPSFEGARTDAELELIMDHVKSFCPERRWPPGELNLPRAQVTSKAFVEDEVVLEGATSLEGPTDVAGKFIYGKRFGARYQFEASLPFGFREVASDEPASLGSWAEGAGDLSFGVKRIVFHSGRSGTILTLAAETFLPTGDVTDGYGRGTVVLEPYVAFGQVIDRSGFVQFQGGFELPFDTTNAENEALWRFAFGRTFRPHAWGRAWSPMVEVTAARGLEGGSTIQWDYIPQLQVSLSARQHVLASAGVKMPMTELDERPTELLFYVLWDWYEGGLFAGW
jgi:mono/diheme cytochrome c family protein